MTSARWSLAESHCPWCGLLRHRRVTDCTALPAADVRAEFIALRGELEAERALADSLVSHIWREWGYGPGDMASVDATLARWEAARA